MLRFSTFALSLVAAASLFASEVQFQGKCENGEAVCYYCPGYDYVLDMTHTSLKSSTINLAPFVGQHVKGTGDWNGNSIKPVIEVTSIELAPQTFSIGGNASVGGKIQFTAEGAPGSNAAILISATDAFVSAGLGGILFLNPTHMLVLAQGTIGSGGQYSVKIDIPEIPALEGLALFGQGVISAPGSFPRFTNSDRKVID